MAKARPAAPTSGATANATHGVATITIAAVHAARAMARMASRPGLALARRPRYLVRVASNQAAENATLQQLMRDRGFAAEAPATAASSSLTSSAAPMRRSSTST